jgi:hypothetical protein
MGVSETTTAPAGADNPQEKRICRKCDAEKVVSPLTWPHRKARQGHYQAHGAICIDCEKQSQGSIRRAAR